MTQFTLILLFFLLAFAGLGAGLLFKRRGLRGSCGHAANQQHDCRCESKLDEEMRGCCEQGQEHVKGVEIPR